MLQTRQTPPLGFLVFFLSAFPVFYLAIVFVFNSPGGGFHGYFPLMAKETILALRTAFAGLAIFTFFPLIWAVHQRSDEKNSSRFISWTLLTLALAQSPCLFGLVLFLVKGAFKTFFAFFALSAFYMIIAWAGKPLEQKTNR